MSHRRPPAALAHARLLERNDLLTFDSRTDRRPQLLNRLVRALWWFEPRHDVPQPRDVVRAFGTGGEMRLDDSYTVSREGAVGRKLPLVFGEMRILNHVSST